MTEPLTANDAEASLLGACLSGYTDLDDLPVEPGDFYSPANGDIWAAILRVHHGGNRPDIVSVRLALGESKVDPLRLFDLTQLTPSIAQAPYYAEQVITAAGLRAIAEAGARLQSLGATHGDLEERREAARAAVDDACRGRVTTRARSMAEMVPVALTAAETAKSPVLSTGWPDLDRTIGGLAPGRLVVFGARPGGGKSLSGTNLARHFAAHHGHAALIVSLEMPESEVMSRLLADYASVNLTSINDAKLTAGDLDKLHAKRAELEALPIFIHDDAATSVQGIRRVARDIQRTRDDLAVIVVDYLQLVTPADRRRNGNRAEEVSQIARDLKLLARETGACVVAMAQLNREGGKRDDGPTLTDIREGGAENDADQVILLHRPDLDVPEIHADVAKNRHGPLGRTVLQLQGHYARLASATWTPTAAVRGAR